MTQRSLRLFPIHRVVLVGALGLTLLLTAAQPEALAAKRPAGAVKLKASQLKTVGKVRCGKIKGSWLPGTKLSGGFFVTHSQQAKNFKSLAKKKKGAAKKKAAKQASGFEAKAKSQRAACQPPAPAPTPAPAPQPQGLQLDLSGAVGLALSAKAGSSSRAKAASTTSNLEVVTADGQIRKATASSTANVDKFFISPNGKVYMLGQFAIGNAPMGMGCSFAEVPAGGGEVTCVDTGISLRWSTYSGESQNPPVQFDASGAIYYLGNTNTGATVLRRNAGGEKTDLVTDNVRVSDFLVEPDGTVFISGTTNSTSASWLRKINPSGGVQSLVSSSSTNSRVMQWIYRFPDNNLYASQMNSGIMRYLVAPGTMDTRYWLSNSGDPDAHYRAGADCGSGCAFVSGQFRTTLSGKVYNLSSGGEVTQYFPVVSDVAISGVETATIVQSAMNHLIVAGQNAGGQNVLSLYDTSDGSSRQLVGPENEIEIYHLNYSSATGKILFDGLRFSDNKFVLGEVDVNSGELRTTAAIASKWQDFQTFR